MITKDIFEKILVTRGYKTVDTPRRNKHWYISSTGIGMRVLNIDSERKRFFGYKIRYTRARLTDYFDLAVFTKGRTLEVYVPTQTALYKKIYECPNRKVFEMAFMEILMIFELMRQAGRAR